MAITTAQTREDIRVSIGRIFSAVKLIEADANGTTTTFVTDDLAIGSADDYNGKWLVFTSGQSNIDGQIRQITDVVVSNNQVTLTFFPAVSNAPVDGATAEMWDQEYDPVHIHEYIQQAIKDATARVFDSIEDISLFADGRTARFDLVTTLRVLFDVYIRDGVDSIIVHDCDSDFDAVVDSDFTTTNDDQDRKNGSSLRMVIGSGVSVGDVIADSIDAKDLRRFTHLEGWVKATSTLAAADFVIQLREGTGTIRETLSVPATTAADIWTYFRIALANPELDDAIDHIYLEYNANEGANTVWFDDIKATVNDEADWVRMPRNLWEVDQQARDLILIDGGVQWAGYGLLKLVGGDNPLLLTSDSDVNEVPDSYIIYRAAGLALVAKATDITGVEWARAQMYFGLAERETGKFPVLVNARFVT